MAKVIKSHAVIYNVLEGAFVGLQRPITCAELMDKPEVRAATVEKYGDDVQIATNKLSDLLGFMWRRGVLERYPADASNTNSRFAYLWRETPASNLKAIRNGNGNGSNGAAAPHENGEAMANPKLNINEHDDGSVSVDFDHFTFVIKRK